MDQKQSYSMIFILALAIDFVSSHPSTTNCILNIQFPLSGNNSNPVAGTWAGFLSENCNGSTFNAYLYGLAQRANQTGQIYLNPAEQKNCLAETKRVESDALSCGIEELTSGASGCSVYSVSDVLKKQGDSLRSLSEECRLLDVDDMSDMACRGCLKRWEEMDVVSNSSVGLGKDEADICRFAVLVSMTSSRVRDVKWLQGVYECLGEHSLPIINDQGGKVKRRINKGLLILVGALVGIIVVIVVIWNLFKRSIKAGSKDSLSEESRSLNIPIEEIYSATSNFSDSNFIGQGIAGKVYKGVLSNGQHVAVKHIRDDGHMETYIREVTSLLHVRHPNLISLLGHCEAKNECFLVYELCHNGNLSEWLFGTYKILSWIQRLNIAIDCAKGLWFLHTYPKGCIVHRDIKPTNILIMDNFQAKLSDFGLSKVIDKDQSHVSSEVRGTFGYVDPEYRKTHHVNPLGDVYSFGIVLLQILSGQRVLNLDLNKPMPINKMAKMLTRGGNISEFADTKLGDEYSVEAFELMLELALSCTGHKHQRPSMDHVIARLEKALDISTRSIGSSSA